MSVARFVPHYHLLSWLPSCHAAAREHEVGEEELWVWSGSLTLAVVIVEQQSVSR